jgi:hypothetical protein
MFRGKWLVIKILKSCPLPLFWIFHHNKIFLWLYASLPQESKFDEILSHQGQEVILNLAFHGFFHDSSWLNAFCLQVFLRNRGFPSPFGPKNLIIINAKDLNFNDLNT